MLEQAEYCLVGPGGGGLASPTPPSPAEMAPDDCQDTFSTHRGPQPVIRKDRCLPDQDPSPRAGEASGEGNPDSWREEEGGSKLAEGKKVGLKKLALTQEQKTRLLDWNDIHTESLRLEAGPQLSPKSAENGRRGRVPKPVHPLLLPRAERETLPAQAEAQTRGTPTERTLEKRNVSPPKSPLRLIASAISRSLGALLPNSEGGRKAWAKPESRTLPTSQPQACTRSFSLRKTSPSKDWDQQSPGRDTASRASAVFSLGTPPVRAAKLYPDGLPDPALRTQSLPTRRSRMSPAFASPACNKVEDVPTLLEKVSLQETFPDASRSPKRKIPFFSSLRFKDRSFESSHPFPLW